MFFGWSQIGNRLGLHKFAAAVQGIELSDAPREKSEVEDREVKTQTGQVRIAEDDLVDERRQCRFYDDRRIQEILKRRTGLGLGWFVSIGVGPPVLSADGAASQIGEITD